MKLRKKPGLLEEQGLANCRGCNQLLELNDDDLCLKCEESQVMLSGLTEEELMGDDWHLDPLDNHLRGLDPFWEYDGYDDELDDAETEARNRASDQAYLGHHADA